MNYKTLITALALLGVALASAESKAYDTVFYKGKAAGLKILFEFGHVYVEASNVKITESASGKTTKFYLSGRDGQTGMGKLRFAPVKGDKVKKEVLLEMDPFGEPRPPSRALMPPSEKLFRSLLKKGRGTEQLNRRFQFHKSRQLFISTHNETLSVIAVLHPQSRLFAPRNPKLTRSPNSISVLRMGAVCPVVGVHIGTF